MFKLTTKIILTNITLWLFIIPSGNRNPPDKNQGGHSICFKFIYDRNTKLSTFQSALFLTLLYNNDITCPARRDNYNLISAIHASTTLALKLNLAGDTNTFELIYF